MTQSYLSFLKDINMQVEWEDNSGTTIKAMLLDSSYVFDIAHTVISDITGEITGDGYAAGGKAIEDRVIIVSYDNEEVYYDASDVAWSLSTITADQVVIYKDTGVASTSSLIVMAPFYETESTSNGTLTLTWSESGIFSLFRDN